VSWVDIVAVAILVLSALSGMRRGLVAGALSLLGLVGGVVAGLRLAPAVLGDGFEAIAFVTLGAAAAGGLLGQWLGGRVGGWARTSLGVLPPLRWLDSAGGLLLGLATGVVACWVLGTVLLHVPGEPELRRAAKQSAVLSRLTEAVSTDAVIDALGRIDPFLTIIGPSAGVDDPDPAVVRTSGVRAARPSVVRVRGIACGVGIEGSGWIAAPGLVVTNAHVVAGMTTPRVDRGRGRALAGEVVSFDARNDVAVVRVPGLQGRALRLAEPELGEDAAALGFPGDGPFSARAARIGRSIAVASRDAYGRVVLGREIVAFRGEVESGSSGGPVVGVDGRVVATVFARRAGTTDGYGVPNEKVVDALRAVGDPVATACVDR
jgi:S1-C subfamily serine protease